MVVLIWGVVRLNYSLERLEWVFKVVFCFMVLFVFKIVIWISYSGWDRVVFFIVC